MNNFTNQNFGNALSLATEIIRNNIDSQKGYYIVPRHDEKRYNLAPNEFLRCALFGIEKTNKGLPDLKKVKIRCQAPAGSFIEYSGPVLTQTHLKVFTSLLSLTQDNGEASGTKSQIAKYCGLGDRAGSIEMLDDIITDLKRTSLRIISKRLGAEVEISLIQRKESQTIQRGKQKVDGLRIIFDKEIKTLFGRSYYTIIDKDIESKLPLNARLARWLMNFYATHEIPQALELDDIQHYTGSKANPIEFKRMTKEALDQLVKIGFFLNYKLDGNKLEVERNA